MKLALLDSLKACAQKKDLYQGSRTHADICASGLLEKDLYLGNSLIRMYAKCGALARAQQVFDTLPARDAVSWNALISGYCQQGRGQKALGCFLRMRSHGFSPDAFTYAHALKACGIAQEVGLGKQIHDDVVSRGLLKKDVVLGGALVDMYAKCGALLKARQVFDTLPLRDVISWNVLIAGYAQRGHGQEALGCFHRMRSQGFSPNAVTYACALNACGIAQDVGVGSQIHDDIANQGLLKRNVMLGNALVDMYAKCGEPLKAHQVFDTLPVQDIVSWNALISGYAQQGHGQEALGCFQQMQSQGLSPDAFTYACILKACGIVQEVALGKQIHDNILSQGLLKKDVVLGNALVDMYAKCGLLWRAQEVFDTLSVRDAISWNALIAGYAQHGQCQEALDCFRLMRSKGFSPNAITYACALNACGIMQEVGLGAQIHDEIVSQGLLKKNGMLGNALVDMYAKCGALVKAHQVFNTLPVRDAISWNTLIAGYAQQGHGKEAFDCFHQMRSQGLSPDAFTYAHVLKACGIVQDVGLGKQIHDDIVSQGLLKKDMVLGGALVDMYAKCGALLKARQVFDALPVRDAISWNVMIAGYVQHGLGQEALGCFHRMRSQGFSPNASTYACALNACAITLDVGLGSQIHDDIVSQGLLKKNVMLGNALVDMYAKCGALVKARQVFDTLPVRNAISWTALIAGYAQLGHGEEALGCFHRMRSQGFSPDAVTYACVLKACGIVQDVGLGKQIHDDIVSQGLLKKDVILGNALVDMYAKCGLLLRAQEVFDALSERDAISWNALIAGYAQHGQGQEALACFFLMRSEGFSPDSTSWTALIGGYAQQGLAKEALACFQWMQQEGVSPNALTFLKVLHACSHSGLIDEGQMCFDKMREKYGIVPSVEHYTCMVDLFGRARLFEKAMRVIRMMPSSDHLPVWSALLCACQKWGDVKLGRFAFERAVQLDPSHAATYILMSNIYAAAGMQEAADYVEHMRIDAAACGQEPARCSCWVDASENVHEFVVGDIEHAENTQIYAKL